jgi:hypothetical protein
MSKTPIPVPFELFVNCLVFMVLLPVPLPNHHHHFYCRHQQVVPVVRFVGFWVYDCDKIDKDARRVTGSHRGGW